MELKAYIHTVTLEKTSPGRCVLNMKLEPIMDRRKNIGAFDLVAVAVC